MPTGFQLRSKDFSTVVSGKEFNLNKSKRITYMQTPDGGVNSLYEDETGEFFMYTFEPQRDQIMRLDQHQAKNLAGIMNEDGSFSHEALEALREEGVLAEEDFHEAFLGIPGDLADRLQDLADEQDLDFQDFVIKCLEDAAGTK